MFKPETKIAQEKEKQQKKTSKTKRNMLVRKKNLVN